MDDVRELVNKSFLDDLTELLKKYDACLDVEYDHEKGASLSFDIGRKGCGSIGNLIVGDVFSQRDIDVDFLNKLVS